MTDVDAFEVLPEQQCRSLLGRERVGRVALLDGTSILVLPVNYAVVSDQILFFTGEGAKLRAATANSRVTFEVDHLDPFARTGWSVVVMGSAREVTEPVVVAGARASGLRPWAYGDRPHLLAVTIDVVSGRRIGRVVGLRDSHQAASYAIVGPQSTVSAVAHPPVRIGSDWSLRSAALAMREANVSSVLVDSDTAIVTERDLARALSAGLGPDAGVATICVTDLVAVDQEATVVEAACEMLRHEIRHLLVCNHRGEVVGLVSLREIMRILVDAMDPAVWIMLRQTLSLRPRRRSS